jgi:hypothetical protein
VLTGCRPGVAWFAAQHLVCSAPRPNPVTPPCRRQRHWDARTTIDRAGNHGGGHARPGLFGQRGPQRRLCAVTTAVQRANANPSLRGESAQRVPDAGSGRGDGWRSTAVRDALDLCLGPAARAVRRIARLTSTWRPTKQNSSRITTPDGCGHEATTRSAGYPCWRPPLVGAGPHLSSTRSPTRRCCRMC